MSETEIKVAPTPNIIDWQLSLPKPPEPITVCMLSWMRYFKTPCPYLCCYSSHCASINCSICKAKLTTRPLRTGTYANNVHLKKREAAKWSHSPNIAKIVSKVWRFVMTTTYSVKSIMKGFTPPLSDTQSRSEDNSYPRTLVSSPPKSLVRIAFFAGNNLLQKTLRSRLLGVRASIQRQTSIITEVC